MSCELTRESTGLEIANAIRDALLALRSLAKEMPWPTVVFIPDANFLTLQQEGNRHPRSPIYYGACRVLPSLRQTITLGFDYPPVNDGPYDVAASMLKHYELRAPGSQEGESDAAYWQRHAMEENQKWLAYQGVDGVLDKFDVPKTFKMGDADVPLMPYQRIQELGMRCVAAEAKNAAGK